MNRLLKGFMPALVALVIICLFSGAPVAAANSYVQQYDSRMAAGETEASLYNKDGYAWGMGPALSSLVRMYETTKDTKYLERLVRSARIMLQRRDDRLNQVDYRGLSLPAWGTTHYSQVPGQHYVWAVHTGMITYPMARFVRLVYEDTALQPQFKEAAEELLQAVKLAVAVHDEDFITGPGEGEGYYTLADAAKKVGISVSTAPFNQQNALGRTLLELYLITGEDIYKDKVTRLAMFMRNRLYAMPDGTYTWMYHLPPFKLEGPVILSERDAARVVPNTEDVSHAGINVDFIVEAYKAGIVFTADDIKALVQTVLRRIFDSRGQVSNRVGGGASGDYSRQIGEWLGLAPYSKELYEKIAAYYTQTNPSLNILSRLAWAGEYYRGVAGRQASGIDD
ncbi:MAG TPA: hypothetical protein GXX29_01075 [Firmicutes bacterium]|nr:hypothetical protein [Bacillota bacterium]